MTTALQITTGHAADGTPQLAAAGEIDLDNAGYFSERLAAALTPGHSLLVDLTAVQYLDSAALAVLFAQADHIRVRISPINESLFSVSGLGELTEVRVIPPA
jgi:anti-anti-sigma factor